VQCGFGCENKKTAENSGFLRLPIGAGEGIRTLDPNLGKVVSPVSEMPCRYS
jgi:hypothetical protein